MSTTVSVGNTYKQNLYALIFTRFESALKWEFYLITRIEEEKAQFGQLLPSLTRAPLVRAYEAEIEEMQAMARAWEYEQ